MKRALFLTVILGMFLFSTNVFAIAVASDDYYDTASFFTTSYPDLITTVNSWTLSNPKRYFDAATLILTAGSSAPGMFGSYLVGGLNAGANVTYNLFPDPLNFTKYNNITLTSTLTLTGNALASLNADLKNNPALLNFSLTNYDALPTLSSVTLQGILGKSVAPEPVSMALLAAGLVGLPFARRLIKSMVKED